MKLSANMKFLPIALAAAAFAFVMMGPAEQLHAQPQAKDGKAKAKAGPTRIKTTVVAQGLDHPWSVAWLPNGDMLVTERPGRVRLVHDGVLDPTPISGVPKVHAVRLSGLMEVLPHPNFAQNHYVYLTYTKNLKEEGPVVATTLARGRLEGKALVDVKELLECDSWAGDGGSGSRLAWGKDGMLYMTVGERQEQGLGLEIRIRDVGGNVLLVQRGEEFPAEQRLARAHLSGELDEALASHHCDQQGIQGLLDAEAGVEEAGVRRDAERGFAQAEVGDVKHQRVAQIGRAHV